MSDQEFAAWLRSLPRVMSPEEVDQRERLRDITRGEYLNHNLSVHRYSESRH